MKAPFSLFLFAVVLTHTLSGQTNPVKMPLSTYKSGEYLVYNIRYGFILGGEVSLSVMDEIWEGKKVCHLWALAKTVGMADKIYAVKDKYHSYFDIETGLPFYAIRDVKEGRSYTQYLETKYNRSTNTVLSSKSGEKKVPEYTLDILSVFYYLRNSDMSKLKEGDVISYNTYFEDSLFPFYVIYRGKEEVKTKYGKIRCLKFAPVVSPGRVFKSKDDLYVWFTDDENHLLILVSMEMLVGHVYLELHDYFNLKYPIEFKKEK